MNNFFDKYYFILFIFFVFFVLFYIIFFYKKKKIVYSSLVSLSPEVFINNFINAFYYSNINNKKITICIFKNKYKINFEKYLLFAASFNSTLFKFILSSSYNYFIFFITTDGILEFFYFDNFDIILDNESDIFLIINYSIENNSFNIKHNGNILKNNNVQKTKHIIKEILKNNII